MEEANDDMHSPKLLAGRELSDRRAKAISTDERNLVKICEKSFAEGDTLLVLTVLPHQDSIVFSPICESMMTEKEDKIHELTYSAVSRVL